MIRLEHVSKVFTSRGQVVKAVDDVSLEVGAGELVVLIGPSGSGKTTTMRMINRLEVPTSGRIIVDGRDVQEMDVVALRRRIGYVIQQGGLFPHFTVADNVAVVPRLLGWPRAKRRQRAYELLELVGLPPDQFADRYPRQLSGSSSSSASRRTNSPIATHASSRVASSSESEWHGRWPPIPRSC